MTAETEPPNEPVSPGLSLSGNSVQGWKERVSHLPRWLWILLALVVLYFFWQFLQSRPQAVTYALARSGPLSLTIAASGEVDGDSSNLSFVGSGTIVEQYVREGDTIQPQQLLARINLTSVPGADDVIRAPYAGSVVEVYHKEGEAVGPGTPVLRVVRGSGLYITVFLDSEDAAWVRPGDRFVCRAGGYLARAWQLEVTSIGQEAVPREDVLGSARQVRAQMKVLDPGFALPLGTAVDVDGEVQIAAEVLQIPASAIVREAERTFVWRVVDGRVEQVSVSLGPNNFRQVAITGGLQAGDAVVVEGKTALEPGQEVSAVQWEEPRP